MKDDDGEEGDGDARDDEVSEIRSHACVHRMMRLTVWNSVLRRIVTLNVMSGCGSSPNPGAESQRSMTSCPAAVHIGRRIA